ncbi:MAG: hypothetical protein K9H84_01960 [Bacteroidales bacterium]|nr:hypothetical protein [Bacteroidales bacterium]
MEWTPILIMAVISGAIVGIVYLQIRKKERLALLQYDKDASVFETRHRCGKSSIKYGLLLTGVGLGILLANIFVSTGVLSEDVAYFSMIFIFGGIALLIDFYLQRKEYKHNQKEKQEEDNQE